MRQKPITTKTSISICSLRIISISKKANSKNSECRRLSVLPILSRAIVILLPMSIIVSKPRLSTRVWRLISSKFLRSFYEQSYFYFYIYFSTIIFGFRPSNRFARQCNGLFVRRDECLFNFQQCRKFNAHRSRLVWRDNFNHARRGFQM